MLCLHSREEDLRSSKHISIAESGTYLSFFLIPLFFVVILFKRRRLSSPLLLKKVDFVHKDTWFHKW